MIARVSMIMRRSLALRESRKDENEVAQGRSRFDWRIDAIGCLL